MDAGRTRAGRGGDDGCDGRDGRLPSRPPLTPTATRTRAPGPVRRARGVWSGAKRHCLLTSSCQAADDERPRWPARAAAVPRVWSRGAAGVAAGGKDAGVAPPVAAAEQQALGICVPRRSQAGARRWVAAGVPAVGPAGGKGVTWARAPRQPPAAREAACKPLYLYRHDFGVKVRHI